VDVPVEDSVNDCDADVLTDTLPNARPEELMAKVGAGASSCMLKFVELLEVLAVRVTA
jgi:hypothetical protein